MSLNLPLKIHFFFFRAYEILSDEKKRELYDQYGEQGLSGGNRGGGEDIFSFFTQSSQGKEKRGKDVIHRLKVTLEDLYKGKTSKLALQKTVICSECEGVGGKKGSVKSCTPCGGRGVVIKMKQLGPGMIQQIQQVCQDCGGEGETIEEKDKCKHCKGKKVESQRKILEVHIDKGMKDGQKIVFSGEGDQTPGIITGDVIIILDLKDHGTFFFF